MMRKIAALTALGLLLGTAAYASSVHLKPPHANPTFVDHGLTLEVVGNLAGLGEGDVIITLDADANVTATCTNPAGATQPPGQNPAPISVTGVEPIPEGEIDNGNLPFDVATAGPATPIPRAPDCPNRKWTEAILDLAFTSATIQVEQPAGTVVLTIVCTFAAPTEDGSVPASDVSCTSDGAPV
jgi:hypothetical protein